MALDNITSTAGEFFNSLSVAEGRLALEPLVLFVLGMVIYSMLVFKFYRYIANKKILRIFKGDDALSRFLHVLEYIFLFPIVAFIWFLVMSVILSMMSKVIEINNIFMISMAIIATIRVTAYYNELLSQDVAKLLPLTLLAIFLLDITSLSASLERSIQVLSDLPSSTKVLFYYFVFLVLLEFFLKILDYLYSVSFLKEGKEKRK